MERAEEQGGGGRVPFARGGPLYVANLVGSLTNVPEFKASIVRELRGLQAELLSAAGDFDDELSIDELRVFTEEELVEKALEALEETEDEGDLSPTTKDRSAAMESTVSTLSDKQIVPLMSTSPGGKSLDSTTSSNSSYIEPHGRDHLEENGKQIPKKRKKKGRLFDRDTRASELD